MEVDCVVESLLRIACRCTAKSSFLSVDVPTSSDVGGVDVTTEEARKSYRRGDAGRDRRAAADDPVSAFAERGALIPALL